MPLSGRGTTVIILQWPDAVSNCRTAAEAQLLFHPEQPQIRASQCEINFGHVCTKSFAWRLFKIGPLSGTFHCPEPYSAKPASKRGHNPQPLIFYETAQFRSKFRTCRSVGPKAVSGTRYTLCQAQHFRLVTRFKQCFGNSPSGELSPGAVRSAAGSSPLGGDGAVCRSKCRATKPRTPHFAA